MKRMNLQFFADEEVPETTEVEETETDEGAQESEAPEADDAGQQSAEENAVYANIRRKAEEDARRKYETMRQQEQARVDSFYAKQCEGKVNPETGAPIRSEADYREALAAQERVAMKAQMQQAGVDPSLIDRAIMASPIMQQAQEAIVQNQNYQMQKMMEEDLQAIVALDSTVSSANDVLLQDNFNDCIEYVRTHPGARLTDAYKIVNFDRLTSMKAEAAKQSAINAARSKDHLNQGAGVSGGDDLSEIPEGLMSQWKEWFPDKSAKELKQLYNKSISA